MLSLPLAVVVAHLLIQAFAASFGFTLDDRFPFGILVVVAVLAIVVALAAAFSPARRAARLEVVEALSYE